MADSADNVYAVLLAGGTGTRLWPVSRELYPKQLGKFIGKDSLVQSTIKRLPPLVNLQNIRVVCGKHHYHEIVRHIEDIGICSKGKVIQEPCAMPPITGGEQPTHKQSTRPSTTTRTTPNWVRSLLFPS